jgi:hypothetical protein
MNPHFFELLDALPRARLALLPTPLSPASELGVAIGLPGLWIKHDELIGFGFGGNKVRGLELLLADARAQGADVLVCEAMHVAATRASFDERVKAGAYADNPEGIWAHIVGAHTPLEDAGRMAREAGVKTLVLNHIIPGGWNPELDDEFYRREAARQFGGNIIVGRDGLAF